MAADSTTISRTLGATNLGWRSEACRWLLLCAAGWWLLHPFVTSRQIGTGDALWYANMLADYVTQLRAGIFPVFVGQTEFAFNGAVYPLRVAPLYQHLAGFIDLLTGRSWSFFALQHATVLVCGFAGLFSCYFVCRRLAPERPWSACGLAVLYLSCPGVLGTIYTQDLYMTWMTVPFLPLAIYGIIRTFRRDDRRSQCWLAAPLAALWFAHSPIALWMTLIAAMTQLVRLVAIHRHAAAWKRAAFGGILFVALAHYPFVSVASLKVPGTASAVTAGLAEQERITNVIHEVFPAVLRPLSLNAGALSDLQLGYALWVVGLVLLLLALRPNTSLELRLIAGAAAVLLLLLLPVPGITDWLWAHLPEQIKRITFYWPMHRFYLLLAALLTAGGARALSAWSASSVQALRISSAIILLGCAWSLWEARQFVHAGELRTASAEITARSQCPENLLLMNHSYGLFSALPIYFSNGAMAPWAEMRLLNRKSLRAIAPSFQPTMDTGQLRGTIDVNPGIVKLAPTLHLEPDRRYVLELEFPNKEFIGVLQLSGRTFFREYALPTSGQPAAFGSMVGNSHQLPLWTSAADAEEVTIRFIPTAPGAKASDYLAFARYQWREISSQTEPVELTSLLPLQVIVRSDTSAWLETPRMFLPGYSATIGNTSTEVRTSPNGLAMIAVPAGSSAVRLQYAGPFFLRLAYYVTVSAWLVLGAVILIGAWRLRPTLNSN